MTRLILAISLIVFPAHAAGVDAYVPPPMFGAEQAIENDVFPPLPPRRPDKLRASKSYIDFVRKYGRAPALIQTSPRESRQEIRRENLIQQSAQDILDQINPQ